MTIDLTARDRLDLLRLNGQQDLRAAPLIRQYLTIPPYLIGAQGEPPPRAGAVGPKTVAEWNSLTEARKVMAGFIKANPPPRGVSETDWFYRSGQMQLASLIRRYSYEQVRNPQRADLVRKNPFLARFVNSAGPYS